MAHYFYQDAPPGKLMARRLRHLCRALRVLAAHAASAQHGPEDKHFRITYARSAAIVFFILGLAYFR